MVDVDQVRDDNPYSESLFRTMKYRPGYPSQPFSSLEAAQTWVDGFVSWYNTEHLHSSIRFVARPQNLWVKKAPQLSE